ncbi:TDT family transporter [Paraburkholderia lycopersici]|uniref:C4-dicarboxylate transporter/malic acid transport protein n=1 Tax=Paraburkholderia lycopersici TaxID=416944 RepID=A0A1G7A3J8_9BURK|nr:TDT family transporter [Paraburkholderia lycopersici]SDE08466.1 C4-dicarboxylate transporter/malic acid transport protein [Paraburkholderia lycopersici]
MNDRIRPTRANKFLRGGFENIRQFTPNWFAVTMGTGVVYLVLEALSGASPIKRELAEWLWRIDIGMYAVFFMMFVGRLVLFSETIKPLLHHPMQSMFLGALPMGFAPIVNGVIAFSGPRYGDGAYSLAFGLWGVDAVTSLVVAIGVPYLVFTKQEHSADRLTAALLLPIVAPEVAASSAALLAPHLTPAHAQLVVGAGYLLWAVSVPLAFSILTLVLFRLVIHKLPHREVGVTSWLALGPIATGSLGLITLGEAAAKAFSGTALQSVAILARAFGVLGALLLWGSGLWWLACAVLFMWRYHREGLPFNLGWWGLTFPTGVYTLATLNLARATHSNAFLNIGVALQVILDLLWGAVLGRTIRGLIYERMFQAPCLSTELQVRMK